MPTISGNLNLVTDRPVDSISEVWVRARKTRVQGDGLVVGVNDRVPVTDGAVEFTALPGAAVLVLVQNGMPLETLPMVVGDAAQQSLRLVVQAGEAAGEVDRRAIEQFAAEIAANAVLAEQYRTEAASSASAASASETAAATSASKAKTSETKAKTSETNAKTSETNAASSAATAKSQQQSAWSHFNNAVKEAEAAADSAAAAKTSETNAASSASASASSASSSATQADNSAASATQAASSRDAAKTSETNAAGSAAAAKTSETNSKQHEDTAGDYAAVATTAATEAVDAMERATEIAGGDVATQSDLSNAVENSLSVDTALTAWTADAVGGRNLAVGASQEPVVCELPENSYYRDIGEDVPLEVGQTYTFSIVIDKLSDDDHPVQVHLGTGNGRNFSRDIISARENDVPYGKRFSITFTPTEYELEGENRTHFAWRLRNNRRETTVAYRELKVERGYAATPWTPSTEDTAQSLLEGNPVSSLLSPFPAHDPALALRVDNSVGTRVFVGDVMIYGDTGWRDISADISDRESGRLIIRRIGDQVFVVADALQLTTTGSVALPRLRVNFYPVSRVRGTWNESLSGNTAQGSYNISSTGYFNVYGIGSGAIEINETYLTDRSWPSTLPGVPA